ncbi:hypothetical protein [Shewanella sp.]|uniref:hypothetical protein n=1 Tax=Shewanella sp. TaxID=50422 RepID=UPI003F38792E
MIDQQLVESIYNFGFLTVFGAVAIILLYRFFDNKIKAAAAGPDPLITRQTMNSEHRLFSSCSYWIKIGVDQIRFPKQYVVRGELYRDLLRSFFGAVDISARAHLDQLSKAKNSNEWTATAYALVSDILEGSRIAMVNSGTPQIVIEKFEDWHTGSINYITHNIASLGETTIANNDIKTAALLSAIHSSTKTAFYNAERTLVTLNGQLSGQQYKGRVVE